MARETSSIEQAQHSGRREAEAFETGLREVEDEQRAKRLSRLTAAHEDDAPDGRSFGSASTEIARLRRQVEILASYRAAVLGSRAWRVIQALRRPFGRAW